MFGEGNGDTNATEGRTLSIRNSVDMRIEEMHDFIVNFREEIAYLGFCQDDQSVEH